MSLFSSIPIVGDIIDTVSDSGLIDNVPVLGTAAKIISGINTRQEQRDATNRAYEFNSDEAQKQRDWEEGMWNKNNLYNSPANQLKLMLEAGLNPNNFQTSVSGASMPGSGASASAPSSVPQTPSQAGLASALNSAQIRLANAQADKAESDVDLNKANTNRINKLLSGELEEQGVRISLAKDELDNMRPAQKRNILAETDNLIKAKDKMDEEIRNLKKQWDSLDEQVKRQKIENGELQKLLQSEIYKNVASAGLSNSQAKYFSLEAARSLIEGGISALNFDILSQTKESTIRVTNSSNDYSNFESGKDLDYKDYIYWFNKGTKLFNGISMGIRTSIPNLIKAVPK